MAERAHKKDQFKFLIQEFHSQSLPETHRRDLSVPLTSGKIVAVYGPRRSGKSYYFYTLVKQLMAEGVAREQILYLNFEDDRILPLKGDELSFLIEAYFELYPENKNKAVYFFFDEIQNVSGWEIFVRRIHDKEKARIFLTGSSSKLLSREIATSLRGRTISFGLYPLGFREVLRFKGVNLERNVEYGPQRFKIRKILEDYLEHGGFPEVVLQENEVVRNKILEEYFESLVFRDLVERHRIKNMELLRDLVKCLLTNSTGLFSVNSYYKTVQQTLQVSRQTIVDYLGFVRETGYFHFLPKFSWSLKEQRVNPQKVICLDWGLRNRVVFRFSKDMGKAVENAVGTLLARREDQVYYWQDKQEVDFVTTRNGELRCINATYGAIIPDREVEGLMQFKRRFKHVKELVMITRETEEKRGSVRLLPLWKWLLQEG